MDKDKDMDTDMSIALEKTAPQAGSCSPTFQPTETTATTRTTFMTLPTELLLQILASLSLPILLDFRLVCTWADTLVLEPVFWHRLEFSKQLLFKTGGAGGASGLHQQQQHRTSFGLGGGASLPGGIGAEVGGTGGRGSVFQHHSANLVIHRQSLAASLLSPITSGIEESWVAAAAALEGGGGPSITVPANIPASPSSHQQQTSATNSTTLSTSPTVTVQHLLPNHSPWTRIETSFLLFLTHLASIPRTARAVRTVVIEDWEGVETVQRLWAVLGSFDGVTRLAARNCVLRHLDLGSLDSYDSSDNTGSDKNRDGGSTGRSWPELKVLDFQGCIQLKDLQGLQHWLPHLEDLSLNGCTSLQDFSPLSSPGAGPKEKEVVVGTRALVLKRVSFVHTRIQDEDLIELLKRSHDLEELRLDQCYGLTVRALEAIAFGDQNPVAGGGVVPGLGGGETLATSQEAHIAPPHHITNNAGPSFTTTAYSPPLHSFAVSTLAHNSSLSSSSASTLTSPESQQHQHLYEPSGSYCPQLRKLSLKNCYDFTDEGIRSLVGCRHLEWLVIRGIRQVNEDTAEWLHSQGVPLRKLLSPLGRWRHWHV